MNKIIMIVVSAICGLIGSSSGAGQIPKGGRRVGIPAILTIIAIIALKDYRCLLLMSLYGWYSMGYGVPSANDEGSALGKFWFKLVKGNKLWTDMLTRGSIALLKCLTLLAVVTLKHNYLTYAVACLGIISINSQLSWRDLGMFTFKGKRLLWSEFWTYFGDSLFYLLVILL